MVPTSIGKMRVHFPVWKKSGNFERTGKVREFYPKCWILKEIVPSVYFYFFTDFLIEVYLLNSF